MKKIPIHFLFWVCFRSVVFANSPGYQGSIPRRVRLKTLKMILDTSLLNTQHYRVLSRVKWSNPGKAVAPSLTPRCCSYWKRSLLLTSITVANFTFLWCLPGMVIESFLLPLLIVLPLRPGPKILFQGDTPEGSVTFQWPVIERDRVGGLRLMIWDKVQVPLCHYSDAPEESNLWTAWKLFPFDDD